MHKSLSELVPVDALRLGMFVELGIGWISHPFPTGRFLLTTQRQIDIIRTLGLSQVRVYPDLSHPVAPDVVSPDDVSAPPATTAGARPADYAAAPAQARLPGDAFDAQQRRLRQCERRFEEAAGLFRLAAEQVQAQPELVRTRCEGLVRGLVAELLAPGDSSISLLSLCGSDRFAAHAVNVTVLSLLLGQAMGMEAHDLQHLGQAAFLHDLGKLMLPERVRQADAQLSPGEYRLYQTHVQHSVDQARRLGLPDPVLVAIAQHHELIDGSGFPRHSVGENLGLAGKILAVTNRYDNLCNPLRPATALTPHEALSTLFAQMKSRLDTRVLSAFIRMLGVHPPGSIIQLTNEHYALVLAANTSRPFKPRVLVHEPQAGRQPVRVLDLELQSEIGIRRSVKPGNLPHDSAACLAPRQRICYFFERRQAEPLAV